MDPQRLQGREGCEMGDGVLLKESECDGYMLEVLEGVKTS